MIKAVSIVMRCNKNRKTKEIIQNDETGLQRSRHFHLKWILSYVGFVICGFCRGVAV